jgi:hypothetical protein
MRSLMTGSAAPYTAWEVAMTTVPEAEITFRTRPATRRSSLELAVSPSAVRTARHWAASVLSDPHSLADPRALSDPRFAGEIELVDVVVLLVSELVTNAIQAAGLMRASAKPRVWLSIVRSAEQIRLEVHDSAMVAVPATIETCRRREDDESGRGLEVISALATDWGWQPEPCGKVVWCELAVSDCSSMH